MTTNKADTLSPDPDRIGSRMSRMNPDIFRSQSADDTGETAAPEEENVFSDEAINDKGQPTDGSDYTSNDHHKDDNDAPDSHATPTNGV